MSDKMSDRMNRQWRLAARPQGMVKDSDFTFGSQPIPVTAPGEVLVRTRYLSCDPAQRGWLEDAPSYVPPVQLGEVMRALGVGEVVESRHEDFQAGDLVQGMLGWQEYATVQAGAVRKLPRDLPPTLFLGVLGMTGFTAYFGLLDVGKPVAGETVLVSGAAGATGSVVGQIARIKGCRAIGIAGAPDKCDWLVREAGFDVAINYRSEDVGKRLRELCPQGVNVYFDNVGGELLDTVLGRLAMRARIVLCGGISGYNDMRGAYALKRYMNLLVTRSRIEGFIVMDYAARYKEAAQELGAWLKEGKLKHQEDILEGLENAPAALRRLFEGKNRGKQILAC
jgi:NADPH-dependent curcumin reductase CurA